MNNSDEKYRIMQGKNGFYLMYKTTEIWGMDFNEAWRCFPDLNIFDSAEKAEEELKKYINTDVKIVKRFNSNGSVIE